MSTLTEIAKEAGVSVNTVSRVLNGKLKGNYPAVVRKAERVRRIATKHGYRPNAHARAIRSRRTMQVGVLLPNGPSNRHQSPPAFESVLGINEGLQSAGYALVMARIDEVFQGTLDGRCRLFDEHLVDGMIVTGVMPHQVIDGLEQRVPQTIWMDTDMWGDQRCIRRDERQAGELAAQAVAQAGYRRAVWITYPQNSDERFPYRARRHFSHGDRLSGGSDVCQATGIELQILSPGQCKDAANNQLANLLTPDVALITESASFALWAAMFAQRLGKQAGRDFGMCCCDEIREWDWTWPDLARATFDRFEMGLQAAQMLLHVLDDEKADCPSRIIAGTWHAGETLPQRQ